MQGSKPLALRTVLVGVSKRAARLGLTLSVIGVTVEGYSQEGAGEVKSLKVVASGDAESRGGEVTGVEPTEGLQSAELQDEVRSGLESSSASAGAARSTEPLRVKPLQTPNTSISGIGTGTTPEDATQGRLPAPTGLPYGPDRQPGWSVTTKNWVAPTFCHYPTYYDDVMLEYHGHERCPPLQPLLSGGRFFTGIFFTPYLMTLQHPNQQVPNAGHFRPGTCAPGVRQRAPYDPTALKVQAAATASGVVLLQP